MNITDGRINHVSQLISARLISSKLVGATDQEFLHKEIKRAFVFFLRSVENIDEKVKKKIASLKKGVPEGSAEWDILYRKYYNEEIDKL